MEQNFIETPLISMKEESYITVYPIVDEKIEEFKESIKPKREEFHGHFSVEEGSGELKEMIDPKEEVQFEESLAESSWIEKKEHLDKDSTLNADSWGTHSLRNETVLVKGIEESKFYINIPGQGQTELQSSNKMATWYHSLYGYVHLGSFRTITSEDQYEL